MSATRFLRLPIFPLPAAILFPRAQLPLHIFEPRYRDMVRDAIDGAGRIAMIQPHRLDHDNKAALFAVGCVGELVGVEELDDGRFNIVLHGANRFRLVREAEVDAAYRCADVDIEAFDDSEPPPLSLVARAVV
jgi:Lon protease-like protein